MCVYRMTSGGDGPHRVPRPTMGVTTMLFNIEIAKSRDVIQFDDTKLPVASRNFLTDYGLKQWLADAHAQTKRLDFKDPGDKGDSAFIAKVREKVNQRVVALRTGVGLPGTSMVDPIRVKQVELGLSDDEMAAAMAAAAAAKAKRAA